MKAIFDFIPKFCPNCGKRLFPQTAPAIHDAIRDYQAGAPHTCTSCGMQFEKAPGTTTRRAAQDD